jgi:hypothetical protein
MREEEEGSKSESDDTDSMLGRWPQREVEELRRDIRNLWHCESNQGIFIMMSAIGSDRKLYGCDMQLLGNNRRGE